MGQPVLSVIIPVYNGGSYLAALFRNLERQRLFTADAPGEWAEVIFVDDGSTDRSPAMLGELASDHANVRVIRQENSGQGAARNHGIREAHGKYIYMMDCDDLLVPGILASAVEMLERTDGEILRFGLRTAGREEAEAATGGEGLTSLSDATVMTGKEYIIKTGGLMRECSMCTSVVSKKLIEDGGVVFPEGLRDREDEIFNWRMLLPARKVVVTDDTGYYYVSNAGSSSSFTTMDRKLARSRSLPAIVACLRQLGAMLTDAETDRRVAGLLRGAWQWHEFTFWAFIIKSGVYPRSEVMRMLRDHQADGSLPLTGEIPLADCYLGPKAREFKMMWRLVKNRYTLWVLLNLRAILPALK
ncbi:MAG: glycosyltransferase [Muribaculaceae bacterium]|nr:glycosyltransferase [Muribaculaceae bacterium]